MYDLYGTIYDNGMINLAGKPGKYTFEDIAEQNRITQDQKVTQRLTS